jgi:type IV pilus assembly protein PilQ
MQNSTSALAGVPSASPSTSVNETLPRLDSKTVPAGQVELSDLNRRWSDLERSGLPTVAGNTEAKQRSGEFALASTTLPPTQMHRPAAPMRLVSSQEEIPATDSEPESPSRQFLHVPLTAEGSNENLRVSSNRDLISLKAQEAPLNKILSLIAEQHGLNLIIGANVTEQVSVNINGMRLEDALDAILTTNGYTWTQQKNTVIVSKISAENRISAASQGRGVQVFTLNYVTATDVDKIVQGLLSPVGKSFIHQSVPTDHRRAQEQLVVEDLPEYLQRINDYLSQADVPPRQVLIEAHVLQVTLKDNSRHGINLQEIVRLSNSDVTLSTTGLATGGTPTSSLRIQGQDLTGILEAIKATTDAKTLASPKVAVLNNQEASMQVGAKIGYLLTTTTQTSTLQSVDFLNVGVILNVLPSITDDGQVLIHVKPQVSTGRINPTTQLPESETTEVETSVLLADGEAVVIGGLIKETDSDSRNKVPILGDLWLIGGLFQRRETTRERNEIIITLLPRIIPNDRGCRDLDPHQSRKSLTPLLYGPLKSVDRSQFEAELPCFTVPARERNNQPPCIPSSEPFGGIPQPERLPAPVIFMNQLHMPLIGSESSHGH